MIQDLNVLESKIAEVAALCRALRAENAGLRQKLAVAEDEKQRLAERMESARERLEQLAKQLPEAKA